MANHKSSNLTDILSTLWTECQGNTARFLAGAYPQAEAHPAALEVSEALAWLNTTGAGANLRPLRVHLIANFITQGLAEPLELLLILLGINPTIVFHPPYQFQAEPTDAEVVVLLIDYEKFRDAAGRQDLAILGDWLARIKSHAPAATLLLNEPFFLPPAPVVEPEHAVAQRRGDEERVAGLAAEFSAILIHWNGPLHELGTAVAHRTSHYLHYDQLFTRAGLGVIAKVLARTLAAIFTPRKKVLCLDADNTLWQGIVGEDGPDGVLYQPDTPRGRCFHRVLQQIKHHSDEGVLLAIVSKNNESAVLEVLARPDFPLKREDFAALRINWQPKSQNLREIAEELNLGLDAFVFVDDSEFELAEVQAAIPEITVSQVPKRAEDYPALLGSSPSFDRIRITKEDRTRKQEYRAQTERRRMQAEEPGSFLQRLQIIVRVQPTSADEVSRVAQLFMKTNQFRFTAARPGSEEVRAWLNDARRQVLSVYYRDIFGDSGMIGAAMLERGHGDWCLRNMVMSCRVIGRGVEDALLAVWARRFRPLKIDFEDSGRNKVAELALRRCGWHHGEVLIPPAIPDSIEIIQTEAPEV